MRTVYVEWWSRFLPALQQAYPGWTNASKPPSRHWLNLPAGHAGIHYSVNFSRPPGAAAYRLRVEFYAEDGDRWWPILKANREQLHASLGPGLSWEPLEDRNASRIAVYLDDIDPEDRTAWPRYRTWTLERLGRFRAALQPIVMSSTA